MPSYYRDPNAPTPNVPRRVGVTALIERGDTFLVERRADDAHEWAARLVGVFSDPTRIVSYPDGNICRVLSIAFRVTPLGDTEPIPSEESAGMQFVSRDELTRLPFWPAQQPIREALLREPRAPVVE
jgi:hypothetical protein